MDYKLLEELANASAPPGEEDALHPLLERELINFSDQLNSLKTGAFYAIKRGISGKYTLMLDAHIDEVWATVSGITEEGFLRFVSPSIDRKVFPGSVVIVHGKSNVKGIIGVKPFHLFKEEETKKAFPIEELFIDCGFKKSEIEELVSVGDTVTFSPSFERLNGLISGKALDDRVGAYIIIEAFKRLKRINHSINVIAHFASQEEFSMLGATTSTYLLKPDLAIVIDVTHGYSPGILPTEVFELGKGPVIFIGPSVNKMLTEKLLEIAKKFSLPFQSEIGIFSGTDANSIQIVESGVPVGVISVPLRYMHTPIEVVASEDIDRTINLLSFFIQEVDTSFLEELNG